MNKVGGLITPLLSGNYLRSHEKEKRGAQVSVLFLEHKRNFSENSFSFLLFVSSIKKKKSDADK